MDWPVYGGQAAQDRASLKAAKTHRIAEYDAQLMRLAEITKQLRSWRGRVKAAGVVSALQLNARSAIYA